MRWRALLFALITTCLAASAQATSGGETVCDVLGWDASTQRVYLHEMSWDGAGGFGDVYFIECAGEHAGRSKSAGWPRRGEQDGNDPVLNGRLDSLRAALSPLVPVVAAGFPWRTHVLAGDTLHGIHEAPRFLVRASFGERDYEVTTYHRPDVYRKGVYPLPGRREQLVVLSYIGKPEEGGYELQTALLVAPGKGAAITVKAGRKSD
ncbi:MAG: hypothetical protein IT348_15180 [Candidatus Eisenbacteria bacterium]|nr:hypothetical protein [Candidatus Eisenbacteria bacterium]